MGEYAVWIDAEAGGTVPPAEGIINTADSWKYMDNGSNQGTAWRASSFDDNSWSSGISPLGFGTIDGVPINTVISSGDITYYFRKTFNYSHSGNETQFILSLMVDDGAVIYLNGNEIFRSDILPTGAIILLQQLLILQ